MAKIFSTLFALLVCAGANATGPVFLDIARNTDGSVKYMHKADAIQYCSNQGARLPSVRELAQLSMSLGAKGIVDKCEIWDGRDNCYKVDVINRGGTHDIFSFSYVGYQRPSGDLGKNYFWSSSVSVYNADATFFLDGYVGYVINNAYYYGNRFAVLCVAGR